MRWLAYFSAAKFKSVRGEYVTSWTYLIISNKSEVDSKCKKKITSAFVYQLIGTLSSIRVIKPMAVDTTYADLKNQIIKAERRILKELGFCVQFKHPHKVFIAHLFKQIIRFILLIYDAVLPI